MVSDGQIETSIKDMDSLKEKYQGEFVRLKDYAERIYDYQKRVSHLLVDSGLMNEDGWQSMVDNNPNYISFYRVLEGNENNRFIIIHSRFI